MRILTTRGDKRSAAGLFYDELDARRRRYLLWDYAYEANKRELFVGIVGEACEVGYFDEDFEPLGICWAQELSPGGRAATIHFAMTDAGASRFAIFIDEYLEATQFDSLLGLLPAPFRNVQKYLLAAGFRKLARMPHACYIVRHKRSVAGCLFLWQRKPNRQY